MSDIRETTGTYSEPPSYYRKDLLVCSECQNTLDQDEANYGEPEAPICPQCFREAMDSNLNNEI